MRLHRFTFGALGSLFGLLGVALGAFGVHGLEGRVSPAELETFGTAAHYQMLHALALLAVALLPPGRDGKGGGVAGWAFTLGIFLFSGSLYLMVFTGQRWLGAITPLGGVAFLAGWGALGWRFFTLTREEGNHD